MNDFDFKAYLKTRQALVNRRLQAILAALGPQRELIRAMTHSLMSGGKRLRPILCLAACDACSRDMSEPRLPDQSLAMPAACALEMIHTYSLIHDDLPAMDNDNLRRGVPTCHRAFNESTAILAGDGLLTHAFYILAQPESLFPAFPDPQIRLETVAILSDAAGVNGMVEGQILDMIAQSSSETVPSLELLTRIHALKTGRMIRASVLAGAVSAKADQTMRDRLIVYAEKTGLAFQIVDDILDVEGDPKVMGKTAGSDLDNHKMTFPSIMGLGSSKKYAHNLIQEAVQALDLFEPKKTLALKAIAEYILCRKG
ncbi:MAG: polyprenyl synthetase family protein [Desulfobacterium sp.]|jgi:geranylgeranyl diphosphate synthase type II|nr:polyprenyl synthetase family protein [Desulfobacterium sp.]